MRLLNDMIGYGGTHIQSLAEIELYVDFGVNTGKTEKFRYCGTDVLIYRVAHSWQTFSDDSTLRGKHIRNTKEFKEATEEYDKLLHTLREEKSQSSEVAD